MDWDTVRLRDGKEVNLMDVSPGLLKKFYQRDVQERGYDDWWFEQSMKEPTRRGKPDKVVLKELLADKKRPRREQLAALRGFAGTMPTRARMRKWGSERSGHMRVLWENGRLGAQTVELHGDRRN